MLSVKTILADYAATLNKTFQHDRSNTVGASEVGSCLRKLWFAKNDTPKDADYEDRYGARLRGNLIEDHYVVPGLRNALGDKLAWAGAEQRTFVDGYLSATPDGMVIDGPVIEIKSHDPRINLAEEKAEHRFQTIVQMGLIRHSTNAKPEQAVIVYVDASWLDDITEFVVDYDEQVYKAAQARAKQVMTAGDPLQLPPEGKIAGGKECGYCPFASHCAEITVNSIPGAGPAELSDGAAEELANLCTEERGCANEVEGATLRQNTMREKIKSFLRDHHIRRYTGDGWSVSWVPVAGRGTLDTEAAKAAGIDLEPFYKEGTPGERLNVKT